MKSLWRFLRVCPPCMGSGVRRYEVSKSMAILSGVPAKFHRQIKGTRNVALSALCRSCKGKGRTGWRMGAAKLRLLTTGILLRFWAKLKSKPGAMPE